MAYPRNCCENCSSIWSPGTEEHDWQQCSACGWSPGDPIDEEEDWDDDFDDDWGGDGDDSDHRVKPPIKSPEK